MADIFGEIYEVRKGLWAFFLAITWSFWFESAVDGLLSFIFCVLILQNCPVHCNISFWLVDFLKPLTETSNEIFRTFRGLQYVYSSVKIVSKHPSFVSLLTRLFTGRWDCVKNWTWRRVWRITRKLLGVWFWTSRNRPSKTSVHLSSLLSPLSSLLSPLSSLLSPLSSLLSPLLSSPLLSSPLLFPSFSFLTPLLSFSLFQISFPIKGLK